MWTDSFNWSSWRLYQCMWTDSFNWSSWRLYQCMWTDSFNWSSWRLYVNWQLQLIILKTICELTASTDYLEDCMWTDCFNWLSWRLNMNWPLQLTILKIVCELTASTDYLEDCMWTQTYCAPRKAALLTSIANKFLFCNTKCVACLWMCLRTCLTWLLYLWAWIIVVSECLLSLWKSKTIQLHTHTHT